MDGGPSLVCPAIMSDPPRGVTPSAVVMCPVYETAPRVPLVLALERDGVANPQRTHSWSNVDIVPH